MRLIKQTASFKRDLKREFRGKHRYVLKEDFFDIISSLASENTLKPKYKDHALRGTYSGYRECHVCPDLLLIYRKLDGGNLELARLGSHSELLDR